MHPIIDLFLHLDTHLVQITATYGPWIYAILFLIIFAETGLVVTPFLPGDSLLFACGALAATGVLNPWLTVALIAIAAIVGNTVNYQVGRFVGPRVFSAEGTGGWSERLLNRKHLVRTHEFFEQYGGKAVVLGRFVPIVRTFVPFVAGAASMTYPKFMFFNVAGSLAWTGLCFGIGYVFGNVPIVKENFSLAALGIVFVSVLPMVVELWRGRAKRKTTTA